MMDIKIEGFKSLNKITLKDVARVNYLVGENGSGKSSVLECLQVFNAALYADVRAQSFSVPGLSKHSLRKMAFKFSIKTSSGSIIKMQLPLDSDINDGLVNHVVDGIITFDDRPIAGDNNHGLSRREVLRSIGSPSFITAYVSTVQELESDYYIRPTFMDFNFTNIDVTRSDQIIEFLNNYYPHMGNRKINSIIKSIRSDNAIMLQILEKGKHGSRVVSYEDSEEHIPIANLSGGLRSMMRLYYGIEEQLRIISSSENLMRIICIEEPEMGFHPKLQKEIPGILQDFVNRYPDVSFFVTTHSPFVVSAASSFSDNQKMYLFNKGYLLDLNQDIVHESRGFKGARCLNVVAHLLGAGFGDMAEMPRTSENFTVVYCEGADKDLKDSNLYKRIFADKNIIFISCADLKNTVIAFRLGLECARFMLGEQTKVRALVDRSYGCQVCKSKKDEIVQHSHEFNLNPHTTIEMTHSKKLKFTSDERQRIIDSDEEGRIQVLMRKEIENYLFDPAIVEFLNNETQEKIIIPDDLDVINGEVKDRLKFKDDKVKILYQLADIIYEQRDNPKVAKVYNELLSYLS